jgi:hypothetical protein
MSDLAYTQNFIDVAIVGITLIAVVVYLAVKGELKKW